MSLLIAYIKTLALSNNTEWKEGHKKERSQIFLNFNQK